MNLHVTRGEAFTHRFESKLDGEPWSQEERTLTFTLWKEWARPGQAVALTISTPDERLVPLESEDEDLIGLWELRLGSSDLLLDQGLYYYTVWSVSDSDPEDAEPLVNVSMFYVSDSGRED